MPVPRWVATVNRRVTNRITGAVATRLPGFAVIVHAGRRSTRVYRTPASVFTVDGGYVVALTYGTESDWVKRPRRDLLLDLVTIGRFGVEPTMPLDGPAGVDVDQVPEHLPVSELRSRQLPILSCAAALAGGPPGRWPAAGQAALGGGGTSAEVCFHSHVFPVTAVGSHSWGCG